MWYLDVEKPAAPRRIQSIKCDVNSFELKWDSVANASLYMLQTCKIESEENNMLLNAPGIYEKEELSLLVEPKVEEEQPICLKVESTTPIVKFEAKSERMEEKVDAPSPPKPQLSIEKQEQEKEQAIVQLNAMAKSDLEITNQTRNLKMELDQKFQQKSTLTVLQTPPNMGKINITCSNSNSKPQVETKVNSPEVFRFDENSNDLISYSPEHNGTYFNLELLKLRNFTNLLFYRFLRRNTSKFNFSTSKNSIISRTIYNIFRGQSQSSKNGASST